MTEIKCEVSQHQSYCCVSWGDDKVHKHIHQINCSRSLDVSLMLSDKRQQRNSLKSSNDSDSIYSARECSQGGL